MPSSVYAMDTSFYNRLGSYEFDIRCEMLAELGYDATYLTLWSETAWADLPRLATVRERHGLGVAAVYVTLDVGAAEGHAGNARVLRLLQEMEGCTTVELSVVNPSLAPSDPAGDGAARAWLERLLPVAQGRGLTLALYPHIGNWLEKVQDAARLCETLRHPSLGIVFTSYHWFAVDGRNLAARLAPAAPYLRLANLCGSRRGAGQPAGLPASIEPLDSGELDNFAVLGALRDAGFSGPLGVQGFSMGGDAYANLRRSLAALRDMEARLDAHPHWARLRPSGG
ncbi:MAG TPA: TIM barrel protein [Deinococcales bacterium]|nr:TIM barrel protein [Deinococcales bacterium]